MKKQNERVEQEKELKLAQHEVELVLCGLSSGIKELRKDPAPDEFVPLCIKEYLELARKIQQQTGVRFIDFNKK